MTLIFKHFDTRLNQWIHTDGDPKNIDSILTEELDNTLLESFFPDKEFSFGQMDEYSTPEGNLSLYVRSFLKVRGINTLLCKVSK